VNEYSWTNLSSILYIEQPVGTGYSQGTPNIENEDDLAAQFVGFLQQFLEVFPELKGKKTYLTGESVRRGYLFFLIFNAHTEPVAQYAGMYVPCESLRPDLFGVAR
jgi:carboxypeptidase D